MNLLEGQRLAEEFKALLKEDAGRIEIAGGVRRGKPEPHDIEIVCSPTEEQVFGYAHSIDRKMGQLVSLEKVQRGDPFFQHKNGEEILCQAPYSEKYYRVKYKGQKVDVFVVTPPAQWGVVFTIRTGDAEFSHSLVSKGWSRGIFFRDGRMVQHIQLPAGYYIPKRDGHDPKQDCRPGSCKMETIDTPEEKDVFDFLRIPWVEPKDRVTWSESTTEEWETATA